MNSRASRASFAETTSVNRKSARRPRSSTTNCSIGLLSPLASTTPGAGQEAVCRVQKSGADRSALLSLRANGVRGRRVPAASQGLLSGAAVNPVEGLHAKTGDVEASSTWTAPGAGHAYGDTSLSRNASRDR